MRMTIIVSIVLSVITATLVNAAFDRQRRQLGSKILRAQKIEVVDEANRARLSLEATHDCACIRILSSDGRNMIEVGERVVNTNASKSFPEIVFRNRDGVESAILTVDVDDQGVLVFNSNNKEGKVMVGHLPTSDTIPPGDFGGWGLHVFGSEGRTTGVGFLSSGQIVEPAHSTSSARTH